MSQREADFPSDRPPLKILFVSAEMAPLVKVGGLGDVVGALLSALRLLGHDARVILPRYGHIDSELGPGRALPTGGAARLLETEIGGTPVYLIKDDEHFGRDSVYGYSDDATRFLAFCHSTLAALELLDWAPDVVHCHDWHTAIIPFWLRHGLGSPRASNAATLLTIHNLAYQGSFQPSEHPVDWLPEDMLSAMAGRGFNLLSQGIAHADLITTVSERYASEITTPEFGEGLDEQLRSRVDRLRGIPNGIDLTEWNPATDPALVHPYSVESLAGKQACKLALQQEVRFKPDSQCPLMGLIGRLVHQKGFDLALQVLEDVLPELDLQVVLLGSGDSVLEARAGALAARSRRQFATVVGYNEPLAHRIYAGADLILVPSRFEPGGLVQLIAQRYGSLPMVRRTGGLADTVFEDDGPAGGQTGFLFQRPEPTALALALGRALETYRDQARWRSIQMRGMRQDFSWDSSSTRYVEAYREAIHFRSVQG